MDGSFLETIIYGRVEPHIYAFRTKNVPGYTKVGDTYRPTQVRIQEWKRKIGDEIDIIFDEPAFADSNGEVFFRDYSVHSFLEEQKRKHRLTKTDPEGEHWYSNEFFHDTGIADLKEALEDVIDSYSNGNYRGYVFYKTIDRSHTEKIERRNLSYKARDNQKDAIEKFRKRYFGTKGKLSLLMYAVMRFGKSFTALQCALAMDAKLVIIVSAKIDVMSSWKNTLYEHEDFNDYIFINSDILKEKGFSIKSGMDAGKRYVLFLSLQDLSGKDVKEKHKELFGLKEEKTLLIVDETHFGARASEYGQVLRSSDSENSVRKDDLKDVATAYKLDVIKNFDNVRVRIHLSGTPYRILMNGEFADNDIISFVQYGNIVKAQKEWDMEHLGVGASGSEEWDNPYFGFPEMIRFAFHPDREARALIEEMRKKGAGGLTELFSPVSVERTEDPVFRHEDMVIRLLQAIDGTKEDPDIFPFLDYKKIKEGNMCRHMVWVLPFQSSCDAMERLLGNAGLSKLRVFSDTHAEGYEILNISGYNCPKRYRGKNAPEKVRKAIEELENRGIKTITLTVQRMLTGSTVPQWDTMLFMKDTSSPQEYDQATFRIQNPYVKTIVGYGPDGKENKIKLNMKPQTLLVDFDPARMFRMQEARSEFHDGEDANGNDGLKRRIEEDLEISPIIHIDEGELSRVNASSIIKAVREYSKTRSVLDEASLIPADNSLLEDRSIRAVVGALDDMGSGKGLELNAFEGDGTAIEGLDKLLGKIRHDDKGDKAGGKDRKLSEEEILRRKLKTLYAGILMFAFLSDSDIRYLTDIIAALQNGNEDDIRIADNLGINIHVLEIIRDKAGRTARHHLDNRIENIHDLMRDTPGEPIDKARIALAKFDRLSASEIVTPKGVLDILIDGIPPDRVEGKKPVFLDVASKQGELTIAFLQKYPHADKNDIYSVATSSVAYEMTRKVYKALQIPVENVMLPPKGGDGYYEDLLALIKSTMGDKNPNIVMCCPPFQKPKGGGRGDGGSDIYPYYYWLCKRLNPNDTEGDEIPYMFGMYIKATWNTHGTSFYPERGADVVDVAEDRGKRDNPDVESYMGEKERELRETSIPDFRRMMLADRHIYRLNDYLNAKPFYSANQPVTLRGGVNIFFWDNHPVEVPKISLFIDMDKPVQEENRKLLPDDIRSLMIKNGIVSGVSPDFPYLRIGGPGMDILRKVLKKALSEKIPFLWVGARNKFKVVDKIKDIYQGTPKPSNGVKVYVQKGNWVYADESKVKAYETQRDLVKSWKVIVAKGSSGEDKFPHSIISQPRLAEPGAVCSDTYLVIKHFTGRNAESEAKAFVKYMKSGLFRFLMLLAKNDQNLTRHCFRFVPDVASNLYSDIYKYFGINQPEIDFIRNFIKPWDSEDTEGVCLNSNADL